MSALLLNCGYCGRFTVGADAYTNWGHAGMDEPPDPVILCSACHQEEYERYLRGLLARGIPPNEARPTWQSSLAWVRAKGVARGMFKHGLAERPVVHRRVRYEMSGTRQVWFCRCGRPEPHPAHDSAESRRLHVPRCWFERRVGRNFGKAHVQEWCSCGWTTGRHPTGPDRLVDYIVAGSLMREHVAAASDAPPLTVEGFEPDQVRCSA